MEARSSKRLKLLLIITIVSTAIVVGLSIRSWHHVDLVNLPLRSSGPYLSAMTFRSGVWIDVHAYPGSYEGGEPPKEVSYADGGFHTIPFRDEFEYSCLADFRFTSTDSVPIALTFPLWVLVLPVFTLFLFEASRQSNRS